MFCCFWFAITGYSRKHHRELTRELKRSLAPATWTNRARHLEKLMTFCELHLLNIRDLKEYDILSYIVYLKKHLKSPGAVRNYISSARTWTLASQGSAAAFDTYHVAVLKRGLTRSMKHTPQPALPIWPEQVEHMARVLDGLGKAARVVKAVLLIGYFTALRQSNLLISGSKAASLHTLRFEDVNYSKEAIRVTVRSTKTSTSIQRPIVFKLDKHLKRICCPVTAWRKYLKVRKSAGSALAFTSLSGSDLSVPRVTNILRRALEHSSYVTPQSFTLHALRRGAVHACLRAGGTVEQVKELGQWKSKAIDCYLPPVLIEAAPTKLKACFGRSNSTR